MTIGKEPTVRISQDEMEAYLYLPSMPAGKKYALPFIMDLLSRSGVRAGVNQDMISRMINEEIYATECIVARGKEAIDGMDGYYEYNFNRDLNRKPVVRPDGTVDFWSIHTVEIVEQGQVIAIYHEPLAGENGFTVKGKVLIAKRGRPLTQLKGRGFERSEDNRIYTALTDGKIELSQNRITISPVYEIFGNADIGTGNIDFRGDLVIHGGVDSGMRLHASGSITIDGPVEACEITAEKDIVLRGGMMGGNKGVIKTKGNLYARFIEYALVEAEGAIEVNSLLNCQVTTNDKIYLKGKLSSIIGGTVYGVRGIEADTIGNRSHLRTEVLAGAGKNTLLRINEIQERITKGNENLSKIEIGLEKFERVAREKGIDNRSDPRRVALLRSKIAQQADLAADQGELAGLCTVVENAKGATINVSNDVFPGVIVQIHDLKIQVNEPQRNVRFAESMGRLVMYSMNDTFVE